MTDQERAERAVEDGECGAQLEIKDEVLRAALIESIRRQIASVRQEYPRNKL
jgi:hypothetical protein